MRSLKIDYMSCGQDAALQKDHEHRFSLPATIKICKMAF